MSTLVPSASDARPPIDLWPEGVPGQHADAAPERAAPAPDPAVGMLVSGVHRPTLEVFAPPAGKASGSAIVVCPGGGYEVLAVELEGVTIAEWFNARGVTAFVLRYRLKEYGHPAPLRDVTRAIRVARSRATEFGIKPGRIGVIE
ncbi:MAG: alpha/beta hydrolase [Opitutaceae bacterium]